MGMEQELEVINQRERAFRSRLEHPIGLSDEARAQLEAAIVNCSKEKDAVMFKYRQQKQPVQNELSKTIAVTVNEAQVTQAHYKKIIELERKIRNANRIIENYEKSPNQKDRHDYSVALNVVSSLNSELMDLKKMTKQEILHMAKTKKKAYLDAKTRYDSLSSFQKLKQKLQGNNLPSLEEVMSNPDLSSSDFEYLYNEQSEMGRSI